MSEERKELLQFPCAFPLKIMGAAEASFAQTVLEIVLRHDPAFDGATMEMRPSTGGRYLSVTCTIQAVSRSQLDALYQELTGHPAVKIVL